MRDALIRRLIEYKRLKGHDITIVFDGWKSGGRHENRTVAGGITIIFSRLAETADTVIKKIICSEKRQWIVVTSDRDIMAHAWSCGSVPVPSDRFLEKLEQSAHPNLCEALPSGQAGLPGKEGLLLSGSSDEGDSWEDNDECDETVPKGNPRHLSKRDKAVLRALGKL